MKFAVAVVTWNGAAHVERCLESLLEQALTPDVWIVDNGSDDDTLALAERFAAALEGKGSRLRLLPQTTNLGYTRGANVALSAALVERAHDAVLLLNQDAWLAPDCLASLAAAFARLEDAGGLGCRIAYPDAARLQHAGGYLTQPRLLGLHHGQGAADAPDAFDVERDVDFATGAALALRLSCLEEVGVFDEAFAPGYYEDVDWCARARRVGWRIVYVPTARCWHVESASFSDRDERLRLCQRNRLVFALPRLADAAFAAEFAEAERAAFTDEHPDALRALALGCLDVLVELERFAGARLVAGDGAAVASELVATLSKLREGALETLRRRRLARLDP